MLGTAAAILLCLLPSQVNALTALAKCLSGYDWSFSTIGQSPCDIALELAQVGYTQPVQLYPLSGTGEYYTGPLADVVHTSIEMSSLCNSVYYSLLSTCAYCQAGSIIPWSTYTSNCTSFISLMVYPFPIPLRVKVPAYAYQDVSVGDLFNVSLARRVTGTESSRSLPPSTQIPTSTSSSSAPDSSSSSSDTTSATAVIINKPAISPGTVGGVVIGGLVCIGLVAALITFLVLRSKQKSRSQASSDMATPNHTGRIYDPNDEKTYPSGMDDRYKQNSPSSNSTPHFTGNGSTQNHAIPQAMQQHTQAGVRYSGMPEL